MHKNTKQMEREQNLKNYEIAEKEFVQSIEQKINLILLIGSGSNGKSYLTNRYSDMLESNSYNIVSPDLSYDYKKRKTLNEIKKLKQSKNIMHLLEDPFGNHHHDVNVKVINMDNIRF
jgi:hypothetical protein